MGTHPLFPPVNKKFSIELVNVELRGNQELVLNFFRGSGTWMDQYSRHSNFDSTEECNFANANQRF